MKYWCVEFFECNFFHSPGIIGKISNDMISNVLHEIVLFEEINNENLSFDSKNSRYSYKLIKIPVCDKDFSQNWVPLDGLKRF